MMKRDWNWVSQWFLVTAVIMSLWALFLFSGCGGTPEQREAAWEGVRKGFAEVPGAVVDGISALETGGWVAAGLTVLFGLYKAGVKGYAVAKDTTREDVRQAIQQGVKRANGKKEKKI